MNLLLCYIAVSNGPQTVDLAARFAASYLEFPPNVPHETLVICNGGPLDTQIGLVLDALNPMFFPRSNDGWDIGGYIAAAKGPAKGYDAMLCCGESVHFHAPGWGKRLVEAWNEHGPGMYGPFSSNAVNAHLNTTCFMTAPYLLAKFPRKVLDHKDRYEFEHGKKSFWRWLQMQGIGSWLVTWDGCWQPQEWRYPANILWRGDQSNTLMACNHLDRYAEQNAATRAKWAASADRAFQ